MSGTNFSFLAVVNHTNYSSSQQRSNCSLSADRWFSLNALPLILQSVMILAQTFNLLVFHFWRGKEPFILLHIALAVVSGIQALSGSITPLTRILPWHPAVSVVVINLMSQTFEYLETLYSLILLSISVDRWLSVEFPVRYRAEVSKTKIRQAIAATVGLAVLLSLPGSIVYWEPFTAFCDKPVSRIPMTPPRRAWKIITGPFLLIIVTVFQARLITIAVQRKLRHLKNYSRQIGVTTNHGNNARGVHVVQLIWSSLRASLIIVLVGAISGLPRITSLPVSASPVIVRMLSLISSVEHIYTPIVYLLFFPQYRAVLVRCCANQLPSWGRKSTALAAPHNPDKSACSPAQTRRISVELHDCRTFPQNLIK
ncbi:hypothetical protein BV898_14220 [Hypsibius exemplaris]|uniref:G-protein coupled receptors family 1 profile domain-containing protein n=1 Tax=Hypsibius exemplaris TaxID=2072580 RepID=A0A1W0W8J5_HYPEX|nr:hypothetical protein BV898_14220 [Hypsibius exemplaris]